MNTQFFEAEGKRFCSYCGKEIKDSGGYEDYYYKYEEFKCDCENAKAEIEFQNNIQRNQKDIDSLKKLPNSVIVRIKLQEEIRVRQERCDKINRYGELYLNR